MNTPPVPANPMPALRQVQELEAVLHALIAEHAKVRAYADASAAGMKALDLAVMDRTTNLQEAARLRITTLENRRRGLVRQIARVHALNEDPKLAVLADLYPVRRAMLLKLRDDLRQAVAEAVGRNRIAGRLAFGILGHLNTALRIITGAFECDPRLYTKNGLFFPRPRFGQTNAFG